MDLICPLFRTAWKSLHIDSSRLLHENRRSLPSKEQIGRLRCSRISQRVCVKIMACHTYLPTKTQTPSWMFLNKFASCSVSLTRNTQYYPQCDGHVKRINRTIFKLLKLNVANPTKIGIWKLNLFLWHIAVPYTLQLDSLCTICCTVKICGCL